MRKHSPPISVYRMHVGDGGLRVRSCAVGPCRGGFWHAVFFTLTVFALCADDFSWLHASLWMAFLTLIGLSIVQFFVTHVAIVWMGVVVFSGFILYDTSVMKLAMGPGDAVEACLMLVSGCGEPHVLLFVGPAGKPEYGVSDRFLKLHSERTVENPTETVRSPQKICYLFPLKLWTTNSPLNQVVHAQSEPEDTSE